MEISKQLACIKLVWFQQCTGDNLPLKRWWRAIVFGMQMTGTLRLAQKSEWHKLGGMHCAVKESWLALTFGSNLKYQSSSSVQTTMLYQYHVPLNDSYHGCCMVTCTCMCDSVHACCNIIKCVLITHISILENSIVWWGSWSLRHLLESYTASYSYNSKHTSHAKCSHLALHVYTIITRNTCVQWTYYIL